MTLLESLQRPSFTEKVRGVATWTTGLLWAMPMTTLISAVQSVVPSDRIDGLTHFYTAWQMRAVGARVRFHVDPAIRPDGVYMFCQNHVNHLDYSVFYPATPHFKQGLENEDHFRYPFYGWFMKTRGTVAVPREKSGRLAVLRERIAREVARGHSLIVFPEGHRTRTGRVAPFRTGVFVIARDLGIPVVPVTVTGMYEVMNAHSWVIRPGGQVTVHCDAPMETAHLTDDELPAFAERVRSTIAARIDAHWAERGVPREALREVAPGANPPVAPLAEAENRT